MTAYGLYSPSAGEFFTYGGRVLVHDNRGELEFLFPAAVVREVPPSIAADQRLPVPLHPALQGTTFPLVRSEFRTR